MAVEPAESPVLREGRTGRHEIEGIGIWFVPPLWDPADARELMTVTTHDAEEMVRRLAREEALFARPHRVPAWWRRGGWRRDWDRRQPSSPSWSTAA